MNSLIRVITTVLLCTFLFVASFRSTGLDYEVYLSEFLDPVNSLSSREVGYVALIKLAGKIAGFWVVLLFSNSIFFFGHLKTYTRTTTFVQFGAFVLYVTYVGLFLIYGSPRRLIAYSIITYLILAMVLEPQKTMQRIGLYFFLVAIASSFHASALVFFPFLIVYGYGRSLLRKRLRIIWLFILIVGCCGFLYISGVFNYLVEKITYYSLYAASEQVYLEDVPSVESGLMKRFVAIALILFGTRNSPHIRRPAIDFCLIEILLYGSLGSLSPVLAVISSYFAVGYLLPSLQLNTRKDALTLNFNSLILMTGAAIFYLPTIVGLIKLFGDFYV